MARAAEDMQDPLPSSEYHSDRLTRQDPGQRSPDYPPLKMPSCQNPTIGNFAMLLATRRASLSVNRQGTIGQSSRLYRATAPQIAELKRGKQWPFHKYLDILGSASNEASGRRIGAKAVLPGLVHAAWPDHGWGSLGPLRLGVTMISANQQGQGTDYRHPEPNWWNMVIPFIILTAGLVLGFFGVM